MPCLLRVTQPGSLATFVDPTYSPFLPCICGNTAPTPVVVEVYPYGGATAVSSATAQVRDPFGNVTALNLVTTSGASGLLTLQFSVGGAHDGGAGANWNAIDITPQDNIGSQAVTLTFYYYKCSGATPTTTTTTTTTSTTTPRPTTTLPLPPGRKPHAPGRKKPAARR